MELRAGQAVAGRQMPDQRRPLMRGDHGLAVGEPRPVAADRVAGFDARVRQSQLVECAKRVARLDDADPVDAPLGIALDDVHIDALAAQRQRGGKTSDAAADDENLHPLSLQERNLRFRILIRISYRAHMPLSTSPVPVPCPMSGRVQDRVIVVTGAASGQGAAEVSALRDEGAVVVATDVQSFAGDAPEHVHRRSLDVTSPEDWQALAAVARHRFGRVDGLINNAGTTSRVRLPDDRHRRVEPHARRSTSPARCSGSQTLAAADGRRRVDRQRRLDRRADRPLHRRLHRQQVGAARPDPHRRDGARAARDPRQRGAPRLHPDADDRLGARRVPGRQRGDHPAGPRGAARGGRRR